MNDFYFVASATPFTTPAPWAHPAPPVDFVAAAAPLVHHLTFPWYLSIITNPSLATPRSNATFSEEATIPTKLIVHAD